MKEGDVISGTITFAANETDATGLLVRIEWSLNGGPKITENYDFR
jgi:hypothetical protein